MKKILIQFAHPAVSRSKINVALRKAVEDLEGVTINDLYASYPDFLIDVEREQRLCEDHDIIIFQHPFYWYQAPAIIKEWQDMVLEHGWAYGSNGRALEGKLFAQVLTGGGDAASYEAGGSNKYTINELTTPFRATANLCRMTWLPPFTVLGIHRGLEEKKVTMHSENYRRMIIALRDDTMDMEKVMSMPSVNSHLNDCIKEVE